MLNKLLATFISGCIMLISLCEGYNILDTKKNKDTNKEQVLMYYQEVKGEEEQYLGILKIPKINLERGFFDKESKLNTLGKNIYYLKESIPLENNPSMIILAAHRGTSKVSFFNNLDELAIGDELLLNYQNEEYQYILEFEYDEPKDGKLNIYRDASKNSLILITCNKFRQKYQTIYVAYRKEVNI